MSLEKTREMGDAAVKAATAIANDGGKYAIIVVVCEIPFAGMPINVATNITSDKRHVADILREAVNVVRGH